MPLTFLYVEDIENELFLMKKAIEKAGLEVELKTVQDGEEAINYLSGAEPFLDRSLYPLPNAMLLDLNLPKKNGFQVLEWVRRQAHLRRLVVIVLTASERQQDIVGVASLMVKNCTPRPSRNRLRDGP